MASLVYVLYGPGGCWEHRTRGCVLVWDEGDARMGKARDGVWRLDGVLSRDKRDEVEWLDRPGCRTVHWSRVPDSNQEWWLGLTVKSAAQGTRLGWDEAGDVQWGKRQPVLRTLRTFGMQYAKWSHLPLKGVLPCPYRWTLILCINTSGASCVSGQLPLFRSSVGAQLHEPT